MSGAGDVFRQRLARIERLVESLEACPDAGARDAARELVGTLLDLHAAGLEKLLELAGKNVMTRAAAEPLVGGMLLLHGLHPHPAGVRVRAALERERLRFHTLGAEVELLDATEEWVRVRLRGDPNSEPEIRALIERLLVAAVPDLVTVEIDAAWNPSATGRVALPVLPVASRTVG